MPMVRLDVPVEWDRPTPKVVTFVEKVEKRIGEFQNDESERRLPAFVGSNFWVAYSALKWIIDAGLASGKMFCEWGSGIGGVTCLAHFLGLDACGIEIEERLVFAARQLAQEHGVPVQFLHGSYQPPGFETHTFDVTNMNAELGFSPVEFDIIYAYPWPAEERFVFSLFDRYAPGGSLLVTFHGGADLRVHRQGE